MCNIGQDFASRRMIYGLNSMFAPSVILAIEAREKGNTQAWGPFRALNRGH